MHITGHTISQSLFIMTIGQVIIKWLVYIDHCQSTPQGTFHLLTHLHTHSPLTLILSLQVMEGSGTMLVIAVGTNSQQGIIFSLMAQRAAEDVGKCHAHI